MVDEADMVPCEACGELLVPARAVKLMWLDHHYEKYRVLPRGEERPILYFGKTCAKNALAEG